MARTPLFRRLQQLARRQRGLASPLAATEPKISRRALLQGSVALTAALTVPSCLPRATRGRSPEVLIVGAGLAGLTAGYRLAQAGVPLRIYEAQARVGGRAWSLRHHFPDGQVAELGGELIDTGHRWLRNLAQELGLEVDDLTSDCAGLASDLWFIQGIRRKEEAVVEAFRGVAQRMAQDLSRLPPGEVSYRHPGGAQDLDRTSLAEWLSGCETEVWMRRLLEVAYESEFGLPVAEQSAFNLLEMLSPTAPPFQPYGESDERYRVRGGNDGVAGRLAERLSGSVELECRLEAVRLSSDGRYQCTFRRGSSSFTAHCEQLILALPFSTLRQVELKLPLPEPKRRAISQLRYGTNAKLMLGFSERVWRTRHQSNGSTLSDLEAQVTWDSSRSQGGPSGLLTNFTGGRAGVALQNGSAEAQARRLLSELEAIYPGLAAAQHPVAPVRFHWPSFPFSLGSYSSYGPGDRTSFGGAEGEAVGGLHFIGEHCSQVAQGFMEGAVESGEAAARAILGSPRLAAGRAF